MTFNIQYVGFKSKAVVREYSFLLRESSIEAQEITFTISNEAFCSHGLRYQDAPDLCSLTLHREMANSVDDPLKTHSTIQAKRDFRLRLSTTGESPVDFDFYLGPEVMRPTATDGRGRTLSADQPSGTCVTSQFFTVVEHGQF